MIFFRLLQLLKKNIRIVRICPIKNIGILRLPKTNNVSTQKYEVETYKNQLKASGNAIINQNPLRTGKMNEKQHYSRFTAKCRFKCCNQIFENHDQLSHHIGCKQVISPKRKGKCNPIRICNSCYYEYKNVSDWNLHKESHKSDITDKEKPKYQIIYSCKSCLAKFDSIDKFKDHQLICSFLKTGLCQKSNKSPAFNVHSVDSNKIKKEIKVQKQRVEEDIKNSDYKCDICHNEFTELTDFMKHKTFHNIYKI